VQLTGGFMKHKILQKFIVFHLILLFTIGGFCQTKLTGNNNSTTIPLDLNTQRPILELMINGTGPYSFIFDTGSSTHIIDKELSNKLNLEVIGEDPLQTPGSDDKLMSKKVLISNIALAGIEISEVVMNTMSIRDLVSVDGILSPDALKDYLMTIDYPNGELILDSAKLNAADKNVTIFMQKHNAITFNIFIDGNKLEAHLDSGNPGGIDIPFSFKDKLHFKVEPTEDGVINTPVASFKKWKATLSGDVEVGNAIYKNPDVNLVEGFQFVNLGYRIIRDLRITIDKKNNLIKFEKLTSAIDKKGNQGQQEKKNDYTGWYGDHARKIFKEDGEMYLQRGAAPKLKLVKIGEDKFEMVFNMPVKNELPIVRFERDETNNVVGLTFVFKDGREDFVQKDK
jgi:hypothetical protein